MKLLAGLSVLQILAILYLANKIMTLDPEADATTVARDSVPIVEPVGVVQTPAESATTQHYPDEMQLRKIVREELAAQLRLLASSDQEPVADDFPDPVIESERLYQRALVEQELEHYISQGTISDADMQRLEAEIAKLDKEGQKEILSRLVRAINTGELEGRL